jgi:hypothetical protein
MHPRDRLRNRERYEDVLCGDPFGHSYLFLHVWYLLITFINDATTGAIDKENALLAERKGFGTKKTTRRFDKGRVNSDDIGVFENLIKREGLDAKLGDDLRRNHRIISNHFHPKLEKGVT